jgi:hypothetical protein
MIQITRVIRALLVPSGTLLWILAFLLVCSPPALSATQAEVAMRVSNAMQLLQQYKPSPSVDDVQSLSVLRSAINAMESATDVPSLTPQNFIQQRRLLVEGWAKIIKAIDNSYDPSFNPNNREDLPSTCVIPPGGLQCGADPKEITDPQARAQYISQVQENEEKEKQVLHYKQVHILDMAAMSILRSTLELLRDVAPEGGSSDYAALDAILQHNGLNQARRERIDVMLSATPTP